MLRGQFALYFAANNGREGLFIYLLAPAIAALGRTPEALRIVSATVGTLTIPAIYFAGKNLFSRRVGILSAAILAVTFWHLALSRVAFRAITLPLMLCLAVGLAASALRAASDPARSGARLPVLALAAGAAFGLTFYTYTSGQFAALLLAAFAVVALATPSIRRALRQPARSTWKWFAVGGAVALAPFLIWLVRHPELYLVRADQVSVLSPAVNKGDLVGTLLGNVVKVAGMVAYQGDRIWRHNLSLRPVYVDWLAAAFFVGAGVCLWRAVRNRAEQAASPSRDAEAVAPSPGCERAAHGFVLLWLMVFLIPTVLAEDAPHFLRAIGALPAVCIVAAIGLEAVLRWLSRRGLLSFYFGRLRRLISPPALLAAFALIVSAVGVGGDYFGRYVHNDMTRYWLEDQNVQLASAVNQHAAAYSPQDVWLQDRLAQDNPSLRFMSPDVENGRVSVVGENGVAGEDAGAPHVLLLVDPNHDWTALRAALPAPRLLSVSEGPLAQGDLDPVPRRAYIAVRADPLPGGKPLATFEHGIALNGVQVAAVSGDAGTVYTVAVSLSTTNHITDDYAVFVHWVRDGELVAQHDGSPASGYLPMTTWRAGDVILDLHPVVVPSGYRPGDEIRVGVYQREDNRRLSAADPSGAELGEWVDITDRVRIVRHPNQSAVKAPAA